MLLKNLKIKNKGNISILTLAAVLVFAVLFLLIFDLCNIFIAREITKNASDAASLAVAQNVLFLENQNLNEMAGKAAGMNGCVLVECKCDYDEIQVTVEKELDFILIGRLMPGYSRVRSTSKTKIIYPWGEQFDYCRSYRFSH